MPEHTSISVTDIWAWLDELADPEIPVLTILDLGIVREVIFEGRRAIISITPTYSGCPAMDIISLQIRMLLYSKGITEVVIQEQLEPAWTTDWIRPQALDKLRSYGIAPPPRLTRRSFTLFEEYALDCPRCNSNNTEIISNFGATSCKALYRCKDCLEPFEHFKCH